MMPLLNAWTRCTTGVVLAACLTACGGGGGPAFVPQFNVAEQALYEPGRLDAGIVAQRGSGGVALQLEAPGTTGLPWTGDTAGVGEDKFYFDLLRDSFITLNLTPAMQQRIEAIELIDAEDKRVWRLDANQPSITDAKLQRGPDASPVPRYQVRITAARTAVDTALVIAWFGAGLVNTASGRDMGKLEVGTVVNCPDCNLSGTQLGMHKLEGGFLKGANLRNSWLVRVPDAATLALDERQVFTLLWDSSQVAGARMSRAYLEGVDFTGAMVTGAGDSPAEFEAAHLFGAIMDGLNLDRVNLNAAFMNRAQLTQASMVEAQLDSAQLVSTNFSGSNLRRAKLSKAMLNGTNMSRTNLEGADFKNAYVHDVNFSGANLKAANFSQALLQGSDFTGADLSGALWTDGAKVCATPSIGACL
jgi:uncharacterized protein YjbI with pentapeptide repeats